MGVLTDIRELLRGGTVVTVPPPVVAVRTKSLTAAAAHAAEDVLSESATAGTAWRFERVVARPGGTLTITKAIAYTPRTALTPQITLYLFTAPPTSVLNDNVANTAVAIADRERYAGRIDFPAMADLGGGSESLVTPSTSGNLPLRVSCDAAGVALYGIAVTRDAVTFTALDELTFMLFCEQDA